MSFAGVDCMNNYALTVITALCMVIAILQFIFSFLYKHPIERRRATV